MIRTLIEISAEDEWKHSSQLRETLDKLGYEPKRGEEHGAFMAHLMQELRERGLDPQKLVEERRNRMFEERLQEGQPAK